MKTEVISELLIHDPNSIGLLIALAYFAAAIATWRASRRETLVRERRFWIGTTTLLVLLGLNKQLDLQTFLTELGRTMANSEGWFGERRLVQGLFLLLLGLGTSAAFAILLVWLRGSAAAARAAGLGIVLLFGFVLLRASSFHHIDDWVTVDIAGLRSGWWLELAGICVTGFSAVAYRSNPGPDRSGRT